MTVTIFHNPGRGTSRNGMVRHAAIDPDVVGMALHRDGISLA